MARRLVHGQRTLGRLVPMTRGASLPGGLIPVRLGRFSVGGEHKFHQQPVLLDHAKLVALLAHHIPVARELPRRVRLFHEVTAVAELGVLLDIVIIPDRKDNAERRDDKHQRDNDRFLAGAQAPLKLVEYF